MKCNLLPIIFNEFHDFEMLQTYANVQFISDFGIFKKDEKFEFLTLNYGVNRVQVYDEDGHLVKEQKFALIPVIGEKV